MVDESRPAIFPAASNAPTGLIRIDGSAKPAYDALRGLIKGLWWLPPTTMVTDDAGTLRFNGFLGAYTVASSGAEATFELETPGPAAIDVILEGRADRPI
jgi:endo-1,4-beta-xylanase